MKQSISQSGNSNDRVPARRSIVGRYAGTFGILLALVLGAVALVRTAGRPKLGYVRSGEILSRYLGMKEAQDVFESKRERWQADIDTLQADYRKALQSYNVEFASYSGDERTKREEFLRKQEESLRRYSYTIADKSKDEEEKIMQGVLNQINAAAQEYGKENGFDLIFGTTGSGSLLYGDDAIDITNELLASLNHSYKPHVLDADSTEQ
jgi:outer membrane protein